MFKLVVEMCVSCSLNIFLFLIFKQGSIMSPIARAIQFVDKYTLVLWPHSNID